MRHELAYLLRLADVLEIDLLAALDEKMTSNAAKYPVEPAKGTAQVRPAQTGGPVRIALQPAALNDRDVAQHHCDTIDRGVSFSQHVDVFPARVLTTLSTEFP
ncbi:MULTISPECIES: hypothetical protein [unclassified Saccharopolyspora]|uniref:hypothetical protein n=1 Tax=unclassified Saccharopolyspora TaxID=2646250 RepID=UPI0027DFA1C4|nr:MULTISPECIES: hypothetical protein [unclassified Saccharopolyspora]